MSSLPAERDPPKWEMTGDQYELFPLPPGPARMFRAILGLPDPAPELVAEAHEPEQQYEIFPELAKALQPKPELPAGMVDDTSLHHLQEKLSPSVAALGALLAEDEGAVVEARADVLPPGLAAQPRFEEDV